MKIDKQLNYAHTIFNLYRLDIFKLLNQLGRPGYSPAVEPLIGQWLEARLEHLVRTCIYRYQAKELGMKFAHYTFNRNTRRFEGYLFIRVLPMGALPTEVDEGKYRILMDRNEGVEITVLDEFPEMVTDEQKQLEMRQ